ncbi:MAG TPA: hypothetical protein VMT87_01750 [Vicinamibacteria bacterium]|nr:hypothetical protein [Vicinamibacteria bacterium]
MTGAPARPPAGPPRASKASPPQVAQARHLGWLLLLNLAFVAGFALFSTKFRAAGGPDVVDLQLAFTAGTFQQILEIWTATHPEGIAWFRSSVIVLDLAFPLAYAAFLSRLYTWVVETGGGEPLKVGVAAPLIAAGLDLLENVLLLRLVRGLDGAADLAAATFPPPLVFAMSTFAALKLALLTVAAGLTLVALFRGPRGRVLARCRFSALSVALGSVPPIVVAQGRDLLLALSNRGEWPARFAFFAFLVVWTLSVWYWARVLVTLRPAHEPPPTPDELFFAVWTPRVLGALTPALAGVAFLRALAVAGDGRGVMGLFAAVCLALAFVFMAFAIGRRRWLERRDPEDRADATATADTLPPSVYRVIGIALGVSLAFFAMFTFWPLMLVPRLGAVTVLIVAAANTVFLGSVAILAGRRYGIPVVAVGLLAAAVFSAWNDNHETRLVPGREARVGNRPLLADAFLQWFEPLQRACGGCPTVPVYLVAAEGGGIRAAYWTAGVLARQQDQDPRFARHVFAISGVSGGSVGAGVFAALVRDSARGPLACAARPDGSAALEDCSRRILAGRFLTPVLAKMVAGDALQWFWPVPIRRFDRATALEDAWANAYRDVTGRDTLYQPYLESWRAATDGVPALLLNAAHVQTGRRIIATPFRWRRTTGDPTAPEPVRPGAEFPDAYDLLGVLGTDLPLRTAMHNSARFAYVSPAGRLRPYGQDRGHVVDGGYFENSGAATLRDLLRALGDVTVPAGPRPRFVVIYVCNNPERCRQPATEPAGDAAWRPAEGLAEIFSPLRALLGSRDARGSLALAELRQERLVSAFAELGVCKELEDEERAAPLPLGWQLSDGVREELDRQVHRPGCGAVSLP